MTYNRGTMTEFNLWHDIVKLSENIPIDGKIGFTENKPAPTKQRTTQYSQAIAHPANQNDYIWAYGKYPDLSKTSLSNEDAIDEGWFNQNF